MGTSKIRHLRRAILAVTVPEIQPQVRVSDRLLVAWLIVLNIDAD